MIIPYPAPQVNGKSAVHFITSMKSHTMYLRRTFSYNATDYNINVYNDMLTSHFIGCIIKPENETEECL